MSRLLITTSILLLTATTLLAEWKSTTDTGKLYLSACVRQKRDLSKPKMPTAEIDSVAPGAIGYIDSVRIVQVISKREALATLRYAVISIGNSPVIGDFVQFDVSEPKTVYLEGFDFKLSTDNSNYKIDGIIECVGTKSYESVLGAKSTVPLIKPVTIAEHIEYDDTLVPQLTVDGPP